MEDDNRYVPPAYIPLGQSDREGDIIDDSEDKQASIRANDSPTQWTSGICACCDDILSCCIGLFCPCYLFGKNAEYLGSGTFLGSCVTHFLLWGLVNGVLCCLTDGILLGLPGCFVACYACGYRRALRTKYNLQEGPCADYVTHCFCHLCAICQEYREIRERNINESTTIVAPPLQIMNGDNE